jgi:hypothetical protein
MKESKVPVEIRPHSLRGKWFEVNDIYYSDTDEGPGKYNIPEMRYEAAFYSFNILYFAISTFCSFLFQEYIFLYEDIN